MPNADVIIHQRSYEKLDEYLKKIKQTPQLMGFRLRYILGDSDLEKLTVFTLADALLKTAKPHIFAEQVGHIEADGTDWNLTEINLLGRLGQRYEDVTLLASSSNKKVLPNEVYLEEQRPKVNIIHAHGVLLQGKGYLADGKEVLDANNKLTYKQYKQYFKERFLPQLIYENAKAKEEGLELEINIPLLGGGAYAGHAKNYIVQEKYFERAIKELLQENINLLSNVRNVMVDYYDAARDHETTPITSSNQKHVIQFEVGASAHQDDKKRGRSVMLLSEEGKKKGRKLVIANPGDRAGIIGVDALKGSALTCDGGIMGRSDIHSRIFACGGYPPMEYEFSGVPSLCRPKDGKTWHDHLSTDGTNSKTKRAVQQGVGKLIVVQDDGKINEYKPAADQANYYKPRYLDPFQQANYLSYDPKFLKSMQITEERLAAIRVWQKIQDIDRFSSFDIEKDLPLLERHPLARKLAHALCELHADHEPSSRGDAPFVGIKAFWDHYKNLKDNTKEEQFLKDIEDLVKYGKGLVINRTFLKSTLNKKKLTEFLQKIKASKDPNLISAINCIHQNHTVIDKKLWSHKLSSNNYTRIYHFLNQCSVKSSTEGVEGVTEKTKPHPSFTKFHDFLKKPISDSHFPWFSELAGIFAGITRLEDTSQDPSHLPEQLLNLVRKTDNYNPPPLFIWFPTSLEVFNQLIDNSTEPVEKPKEIRALMKWIKQHDLENHLILIPIPVKNKDGSPSSIIQQDMGWIKARHKQRALVQKLDSSQAKAFQSIYVNLDPAVSSDKFKENKEHVRSLTRRFFDKKCLLTDDQHLNSLNSIKDLTKHVIRISNARPKSDWHDGLKEVISLDRFYRKTDPTDPNTHLQKWSEMQILLTHRESGLRRTYSRSGFFGNARMDEIDFLYYMVAKFDDIHRASHYQTKSYQQILNTALKSRFIQFIDSEIKRLEDSKKSVLGPSENPDYKIEHYKTLKKKFNESLLKLDETFEKALDETKKIKIEVKKEGNIKEKHSLFDLICSNRKDWTNPDASSTSRKNFTREMNTLLNISQKLSDLTIAKIQQVGLDVNKDASPKPQS